MYQLFVDQRTSGRLSTTNRRTDIRKESKSRTFIGAGGGWEGARTRKEGKFSNYQQNKKVFFFKKKRKKHIQHTKHSEESVEPKH